MDAQSLRLAAIIGILVSLLVGPMVPPPQVRQASAQPQRAVATQQKRPAVIQEERLAGGAYRMTVTEFSPNCIATTTQIEVDAFFKRHTELAFKGAKVENCATTWLITTEPKKK